MHFYEDIFVQHIWLINDFDVFKSLTPISENNGTKFEKDVCWKRDLLLLKMVNPPF